MADDEVILNVKIDEDTQTGSRDRTSPGNQIREEIAERRRARERRREEAAERVNARRSSLLGSRAGASRLGVLIGTGARGVGLAAAGAGVAVAGVAAAGLAGLATATRAAHAAMTDMADGLAEINASIAASQAQADVSVLQARFRQGQQLAPELSSFIQERAEWQIAMIELKTTFVEIFAPAVLLAMNVITAIIQGVNSVLETIKQLFTDLFQIVADVLQNVNIGFLANLGLKLDKWLDTLGQDAPANDLWNEWDDFLDAEAFRQRKIGIGGRKKRRRRGRRQPPVGP